MRGKISKKFGEKMAYLESEVIRLFGEEPNIFFVWFGWGILNLLIVGSLIYFTVRIPIKITRNVRVQEKLLTEPLTLENIKSGDVVLAKRRPEYFQNQYDPALLVKHEQDGRISLHAAGWRGIMKLSEIKRFTDKKTKRRFWEILKNQGYLDKNGMYQPIPPIQSEGVVK